MVWRGQASPLDRFWACLVYLLPLTSALSLGQGFLESVPALIPLFVPLFRLAMFMNQFGGFTSLIVFLVLFFLVVRNPRVAHFVRFNTMQALLVEIARYIAVLILGLLVSLLGGLGVDLIIQALMTTLFLGIVAVTGFAWFQNARGHYPEVPVLSEAAYSQVG
ncbi:MAG: Tic20 family protein [Thermostichales cyanobacterium BF4_bins_65]